MMSEEQLIVYRLGRVEDALEKVCVRLQSHDQRLSDIVYKLKYFIALAVMSSAAAGALVSKFFVS